MTMRINRRRLVCGVGINDADYQTTSYGRGTCPYYSRWVHMLHRCYSPVEHTIHPTYADCRVSPAWLSFMGFKGWMETQDWVGKHLDKDILIPGNKLYADDRCVFVTQGTNKILLSSISRRGEYPLGVNRGESVKLYVAFIKRDGKTIYLGKFDTPREAHQAWQIAKEKQLRACASEQDDPRVSAALVGRADDLLLDILHDRETLVLM